MSINHSLYIESCFKLALKGAGSVSPNPLVGSVIVKNGEIIGEGWHKKSGEAHAEVDALNNSKENVKGATLYCNLEPCCHTNKKTLPCVPLIIQKKIKKVIISNLDPNPEVNGEGVRQLREAGIEVIMGISEKEGMELNKFYFKYIKEKLPYITLKIAQSVDGKIGTSNKKQIWLTGKESVKYVHKLRSKYDAVLVGANTIKTDNPQLNVREVRGRNPVRIIIDGRLSTPIKSFVVSTTKLRQSFIFTSDTSDKKKINLLTDKGVNIFQLKSNSQKKIKLNKIIQELGLQKITSVLVEGGSEIFSQFIEEELFDELIILQAPAILGKGIGYLDNLIPKKLHFFEAKKLGNDILMAYRRF